MIRSRAVRGGIPRSGATLLALALFVGAGSASPAMALQKTPLAVEDEDPELGAWFAGATCTVLYHNLCTGWIWSWDAWSPEDRLGVVFDPCCPSATLQTTTFRALEGAPSGYGFTGTIEVGPADTQGCPASPSASRPFLPEAGWNGLSWDVPVSGAIALVVTLGPGSFNPSAFASDHPAAGPTGPQACGNCFPSSRTGRSFYFGKASSPLCPGIVLFDGTCDAEFLAVASFACPVSVGETMESGSWAEIKALYR
ncbi:hypothetical protein K8I85_03000 [bacterium]|nr:hypothetical protein [bacterium]